MRSAHELKSFLSVNARSQIAKCITPLASDVLPPPQDLTLFWENCEHVLLGLHPEVKMGELNSEQHL